MTLKDSFVKEILKIFHREDVKDEIKEVMRPVIDMLLKEIYPIL